MAAAGSGLWMQRCRTGGQVVRCGGQLGDLCGHWRFSKNLWNCLLPRRSRWSRNHPRHRARRLAPGGLRSGKAKGNRSRVAKVRLPEGVARERMSDSAGGNSRGDRRKSASRVSRSKRRRGQLARDDLVRVPPTHTWRGPHTRFRGLSVAFATRWLADNYPPAGPPAAQPPSRLLTMRCDSRPGAPKIGRNPRTQAAYAAPPVSPIRSPPRDARRRHPGSRGRGARSANSLADKATACGRGGAQWVENPLAAGENPAKAVDGKLSLHKLREASCQALGGPLEIHHVTEYGDSHREVSGAGLAKGNRSRAGLGKAHGRG